MAAESAGFARVSRVLIGAMVAVVLSVMLSALYARQRLSNAAELVRISGNAAPSMNELAIARSHLHRLDVELDHAVAMPGPEAPLSAIDDETRAIRESVDRYARIPTFPGEPEEQQRLYTSLRRLDHVIERVRARLAGGDERGATRLVLDEFDAALEDVDGHMATLVAINGEQIVKDAASIKRTQRRNNWFILALFGGTIALAAAATLLVIRVIRRYFMVLDRRSKELEYFAIQIGHDVLNPLTPIAAALRIAQQHDGTGALNSAIDRGLRGVDRIQRNVTGLLAFARAGERSPPEAIAPLRRCIEDVIADLAAEQRVVVEEVADGAARCADGVLARVVRAMLADALGRADGGDVRLRASVARGRVSIEIGAGPALWPGVDLFAPRIRGTGSGYPGIELEMLTARELVETHGGSVGTTADHGRCVTFAELPSA